MFPKYNEICLENLMYISEGFEEMMFSFLPIDYINNLFMITFKIMKKTLSRNFKNFFSLSQHEEKQIREAMLIVQNICSFCFEESRTKTSTEIQNNIKNFIDSNTQVKKLITSANFFIT